VNRLKQIMKGIKAIADENRFKIIELLLEKRFCVSALAKRLDISESAVSQQLKILRKANLVIGIKKGYYVHYKVEKEELEKIGDFISSLFEKK